MHDTHVVAPFSTSDHSMVKFKIINNIPVCNVESTSFDYNCANWVGIFEFLNRVDIIEALDGHMDIASKMDCFYSILNDCITANVPVVKSKKKVNSFLYPMHIRRWLHKKTSAWRVYSHVRTESALSKYKQVASKCRLLIYNHALRRENKVVNSDNISSFYRHCNRKFKCQSIIGPIKDHHGVLITDPRVKANVFQHSFSSFYTKDNGSIPQFDRLVHDRVNFNNVVFSPSLVNKAIKKLRTKSRGGPDHIPPVILSKCALWLSPIIAYLFQLCFDSGFMPLIWSKAYITPVFKKGDPTDASNYRPIALTCVMCKLMESIIKDQLLSYLLFHKLISKHQHAFITNHSTATNLLECANDWSAAINAKKHIDIVYIDFCRAFDSIVYSKLLSKLQSFGIGGNFLLWLGAFLRNRSQRVCVDNCLSDECVVLSGVPQGSVLGPILFLLFINDIDSACNCNSTLKLFADDLKIYSIFDAINYTNNCLQDSINNVCEWAAMWQFTINVRKCSALHLRNKKPSDKCPYFIDGTLLPDDNSVTDLGVLIDDKLSYKGHINVIVSKAMQRIGLLFRGFLCRDLTFLKKAFVTYIRPLVEYCSVVWSPCLKKYIDVLEKVQRKFSKRIPCLSSLPYKERLARLNLLPLELRRLHFDLTFYYKLFTNRSSLDIDKFFTFHTPPASSRNPMPFIQKPQSATNFLLSSFRYRSIDSWNSLPLHVKNSSSLSSFKKALHTIDFASFLYGSTFTALSDFNTIF